MSHFTSLQYFLHVSLKKTKQLYGAVNSLWLWVITRVVLSSYWRSETAMRCKWLFESISIHLIETLQRPMTLRREMSFVVRCKRNLKCKLGRLLRSQLASSLSYHKHSITDFSAQPLQLFTQTTVPALYVCVFVRVCTTFIWCYLSVTSAKTISIQKLWLINTLDIWSWIYGHVMCMAVQCWNGKVILAFKCGIG